MPSVMIKISTDFLPIQQNIVKYEAFLNHSFEALGMGMMMETIVNGLLYLFDTRTYFEQFLDKVFGELLDGPVVAFDVLNPMVNLLLHNVVEEESFPPHGVRFYIEYMINEGEDLSYLTQKYPFSYLDRVLHKIHPDITIRAQTAGDPRSFLVNMPTYASIRAFGNFLFYVVYKLDAETD